MMEGYKQKYTFGSDFGTSHFKYGPITLGDKPAVMENRGYLVDRESLVHRISGVTTEIVVGAEVAYHLESKADLASRLIYPMRNGIIERNEENSWRVVYEVARTGLSGAKPSAAEFEGYFVVASLAAIAPKYMYERLVDLHKRIDAETKTVKALTIIPQPLAVAIAHKVPTCTVLESGHGNTQVCPISKYPVRNAIVAINRGGGDANTLTAEILKDAGYGDLASEEALVRGVKEAIGLVPLNLDRAIRAARAEPEKYAARFRLPGTRIDIDLGDESWTRFLIGEYVFNPNNELFRSYFKRGMPKPPDIRVGDTLFEGMLDFGEAIVCAVERCPVELQSHLYRTILLSGGNFAWKVPPEHKTMAVDAATKVRLLLQEKGIDEVNVILATCPQYSVWRGCIVYGYAAPADYSWSWERMEGWIHLR